MGTSTLTTRASGNVITAAFFNDFNAALAVDFVGRNASNVATSGQNLGTSAIPWGSIFGSELILGGTAIDTTKITAFPFRVVSGSVRSTSNQPAFLDPAGSGNGATVTLLATTTDFVFTVGGSNFTLTSDIAKASLSAAASTNNTALVNDTDAADQESTRTWGEVGAEKEFITIDTVGTNISAKVGEFHGFKINDGSNDEYFIAFVESATKLSLIKRGYFYDDSIAPINRIKFANDDTITLMNIHYVFADSDLTTVDTTVNAPIYSGSEPSGPSTGDYWFDSANSLWKRHNGSNFVSVNRAFIGWAVMDDTDCVAARSTDFDATYSVENSIIVIRDSNTVMKGKTLNQRINIAGTVVEYVTQVPNWDMAADLAAAADMYNSAEQANTTYYLYIKDDGDPVISDLSPYLETGRAGKYHPHNPWRLVGTVKNNGSSNLSQDDLLIESENDTKNPIRSSDRNEVQVHRFAPFVRAAETLSANDAVSLKFYKSEDDANNSPYLYNKSDHGQIGHVGILLNATTEVSGVYTYTISGAMASGDVATGDVVGSVLTSFSVTFATDSDTTLAAIATQIATHPDVASAVVTAVGGGSDNDVEIVVTGNDGITISLENNAIAGGNNPTVTIAETTKAGGNVCRVVSEGPVDGFSSLNQGRKYFLSTTAGSITSTPTGSNPTFVGTAMTDTVLFVNSVASIFNFPSDQLFIRSHGSSNVSHTGGSDDTEHFNFTSWSTGTAQLTNSAQQQLGNGTFLGQHVVVDGVTTSNAIQAIMALYNKTSWSTDTTRTAKQGGVVGEFNGLLTVMKGSTNTSSGGAQADSEEWDASSWSALGGTATGLYIVTGFVRGSKIHVVNGINNAAAKNNEHRSWNGSAYTTETAHPATEPGCGAGNISAGDGLAMVNFGGASAESSEFSGSSWSAELAIGRVLSAQGAGDGHFGSASAWDGNSTTYVNGGSDSGSPISTTSSYDSTSWSSETASTLSRAGGQGSII